MKDLSKTFLFCALVSGAMLIAQIGCSSSPTTSPNTAVTQPSAAPSPTVDASTAQMATSPAPAVTTQPTAPAAGSGGTAANPATPAVEKPAPTPAPPRTYTLASGRVLSVYTASDLSTKTASSGQKFTGSLANAIVDGNWVIAKKGAPVHGVVVTSDPGGKVKGVASISVRLESLTLADGRTVNLSTSTYSKQAKGTKKKDAAKIGIGAGVGAAIGAIAGGGKGAAIGAGVGGAGGTGLVLATRGEAAVIPSESQLTFRLSSPIKITKR